MSKGDFGYGSTVREYRDDPSVRGESPRSFGGGYQAGGNSSSGSFDRLVDAVSTNVFTINNNATTLEKGMKQIGTSTDSVQLRDRIHSTELSTNDIITTTAQLLKQLGQICSRNHVRAQKLQYERLYGEFKVSIQRYNELQKKVASKVKSTAPLVQPDQQPPASDLINWGDIVDDDQRLVEREQRREQIQAQQQLDEQDLAMLQEREEMIRQLESDILDINEIFKDLGTMVHEQGAVIDTIEANVENAYDHVEAGQQQLIQASRYQRKARKKMCIIIIVLLIIGLILGLVIYLSVR